jgi:hypothetical protein
VARADVPLATSRLPGAASVNVCPFDDAVPFLVDVVVASDNVKANHARLPAVAGMVGAVEGDITERGEPRRYGSATASARHGLAYTGMPSPVVFGVDATCADRERQRRTGPAAWGLRSNWRSRCGCRPRGPCTLLCAPRRIIWPVR